MRGNPIWFVIVLLVGAAISLVGLLIGDWWLTFPAGLLVGFAIAPAKLAVPTGALAGLLGWVLPLSADHARYGLGAAAGGLAAVMGYTGQSAVPLILTSLVGLLLGLTGAWLASAARLMVTPATR
jgi:hypothetical protein